MTEETETYNGDSGDGYIEMTESILFGKPKEE